MISARRSMGFELVGFSRVVTTFFSHKTEVRRGPWKTDPLTHDKTHLRGTVGRTDLAEIADWI